MSDQATHCPIPSNEMQRLRAVRSYEILDTLPEMEFDTLTRVAAHALGTPAAVIGLMDSDRLWFKSRLGLEVPQLDRQIAFCAHAIMQPDEPLVVEDLRQDRRFQGNPLVTQAPHLCFYAGAPLIDRNGYVLGTIAVVDTKPRAFSEDQRALLRDLSRLVIAALESRHLASLLGHLAMTDHLTGLANRAQFERTLNSEIAYALRTGEPFTVFYMDLDDFKRVNDTLGHAAGDEVLCEVARRMTDQVRAEDLLARLGGDEFGVFMRPSAEDPVESLAKRIIEVVSAPITLSTGDRVSVGISIGIANYTDSIGSMAALLAQADQALYGVKRKK
jgi:diguanylate cyclase (GGDEF)-like protein